MDNQVTIHDLNNRDSNGQAKVIREISAFEGFLSCARFLSDSQLVTGSADMKMYAPSGQLTAVYLLRVARHPHSQDFILGLPQTGELQSPLFTALMFT